MAGSLAVRKKNAAKARAKKPSAVERQVQSLFGLTPGLKRGNILPFAVNPKTGKPELGAPQFVYDMARAFAAPGVAASGQPIDTESEATNFAANFTGTGGVASRATRGAVGEGRAVLGMSGAPKGKPQPMLPAPPKVLALPAPGPGLPPYASKPRGGQFWVDKNLEYGNTSPEEAARSGAQGMGIKTMEWTPDDEYGVINLADPAPRLTQTFNPPKTPEQQWLEKALTKYYKNDFGAPDDPLRALAERGLHYDPEMTPERWKATVDSYLGEDTIGDITVPNMLFSDVYPGVGDSFTTEARMAMPWLAKLPVTDKLYSIQSGGLDLGHFTDEFHNALNPEISGLPMDLAVRPESLGRMTFAQAAEHVGKINQFRAKEMERAALGNLNSPAVQTFKEYSENNPLGLRWTELKAPSEESGLFRIVPAEEQGVPFHFVENTVTGERTPIGGARENALRQAREMYGRQPLQDALKYEGDTMGHCVGGYCPDVMEGRSRIFSLRDAKGEPHVTIETRPTTRGLDREDRNAIFEQARLEIEALDIGDPQTEHRRIIDRQAELADALRAERAANPSPDDIIQIKGKQNRAPKDDYLPFVQDFVKSQQWGNVGDLGNTGLVKLPDGRYITVRQAEEGITAIPERTGNAVYDPTYLHAMDPEIWEQVAPHFQGFAIGGRVDADRCFCRHPMSVKR